MGLPSIYLLRWFRYDTPLESTRSNYWLTHHFPNVVKVQGPTDVVSQSWQEIIILTVTSKSWRLLGAPDLCQCSLCHHVLFTLFLILDKPLVHEGCSGCYFSYLLQNHLLILERTPSKPYTSHHRKSSKNVTISEFNLCFTRLKPPTIPTKPNPHGLLNMHRGMINCPPPYKTSINDVSLGTRHWMRC